MCVLYLCFSVVCVGWPWVAYASVSSVWSICVAYHLSTGVLSALPSICSEALGWVLLVGSTGSGDGFLCSVFFAFKGGKTFNQCNSTFLAESPEGRIF